MNGFLADTNALSELSRPVPHPAVAGFLAAEENLWLSVIVIGELEFGVQSLPEGSRRDGLRDWLAAIVREFDDRILPIEAAEAEWSAAFSARVRRTGGTLTLADALIAGTAMVHGLAVVTRNVRDFDGLGIDVVNPWNFHRPA